MTRPVRLLLVDDNALDRDMLSRRLARRGFDVQLAADGGDALERAQWDTPDLVVLDTSLPVLDGFAVTRRLKADARTGTVPVLILTAHALLTDRERALAAGCDDFDTKPVELPRLLGKIDALLAASPPRLERTLALSPLALDHLSEIRAFLTMALQELGVAGAVDALVLAVDEVCTNLVQHAEIGTAPGPTRVTVRRAGSNAILTIEDRGQPFHPAEIPAPELTAEWQDRPIGGLGWFLVQQMVDEVHYRSTTETDGPRNRLVLIKYNAAVPDHPAAHHP
jgi:CheY-like chemotaxis protein/anti-sigma regulatory factor (Ser/Thr protein kinase)